MPIFDTWTQRISAVIGIIAAAGFVYAWMGGYLRSKLTRKPETFQAAFAVIRDTLNSKLGSMAHVWALRAHMPETQRDTSDADELPWITDGLLEAAAKLTPTVNATHGLALDKAYREGGRTAVRFFPTDYRLVKASRDAGHKPPIISAGGILFLWKPNQSAEVLLRRRSAKVATYPNCLHILGGNYEPRRDTHEYDDAKGDPLRRAALREIDEEVSLDKIDAAHALVLISDEIETGFVQFNYRGLRVSPDRRGEIKGSGEGVPVTRSGRRWRLIFSRRGKTSFHRALRQL